MSKIFISGLPWEVTENELLQWLKDEAGVLSSEVLFIKIPKWYDSGRSRGYAFVDLSGEPAMKKCLAANKKRMGDRFLDINTSKPTKKRKRTELDDIPDDCKLLFVKNLPYDTTEILVRQKFEKFGSIESVRLGRWNNTGRLKGFGYVKFKKNSGLRNALLAEEISLAGRLLHLDFEVNDQPKKSFRDTSGKYWYKK